VFAFCVLLSGLSDHDCFSLWNPVSLPGFVLAKENHLSAFAGSKWFDYGFDYSSDNGDVISSEHYCFGQYGIPPYVA
jgi:hypothetical protein